VFQFDPAAGCKLMRTNLDSPPLGLGSNSPPAKGDHADLFGSWEFSCADAAKAAYVDVGLFAFKQLKRVQVQLALPKTQAKSELKRPKARISLAP